MDEDAPEPTPSVRKLSKTPSWITLGFLLGAAFVWSLPEPQKAPEPELPTQVVKLERPQQTEIEAVFSYWQDHAVWENDLTEVALWDTERKSYSICYEVLRNGDLYYFRTIPHLTRPVLTRGIPSDTPLQFTEPEARRREWLQEARSELWKIPGK